MFVKIRIILSAHTQSNENEQVVAGENVLSRLDGKKGQRKIWDSIK